MRVILLDNVRGIGKIGDIKDVKDGYARNFLFPRNLGKLATRANQKEAETLKAKRVILLAQEEERALQAAEKLKDLNLEITARTSPTGSLYASINKAELIKHIKEKAGVELTTDMIVLHDALKSTGSHQVQLDLADNVSIPITVTVSPEKN